MTAPSASEIAAMDAAAVHERLHEFDADTLVALVERANREYWQDAAASFPDPLYDRLVEALRRIRPDAPVLVELGERVPAGPTLDVEQAAALAPIERLGSAVRHRRQMLSLDKCYSPEELLAWVEKFEGEILVMPKMDGIACSLRYGEDGRLEVAATRGNGREGEDITVNALDVTTIPERLESPPGAVEIRGEIFMRLSIFERYKERFSNPRNLTAGAIKHKERGRTRGYDLSFFAYDIDGPAFDDEREKLAMLAGFGFVNEHTRVCGRDEIVAAFEDLSRVRPALDYEIDGVVFRASSTAEQRRMGSTAHHPRWSLAYKFQGDSGTTRLEKVLWSVSRTGTITPVAILAPIELSGAMIGRASLHNLNRFEELNLREGATVEVTRRGGVIPNVEHVVEAGEGAAFEIPPECPACGGPVERRKKRDGEFLYCVDPSSCTTARLRELEHFAKVVDIQGFGPKIIARAVDKGLLSAPVDYYRLRLEDLEAFDRLGRRSAQNLVDEVNAHRRVELPTFLQSLGIQHLGRQNATLIAQQLLTLDAVRAASVEQIASFKGFSEIIATALVRGLEERRSMIDALLQEVEVHDAEPAPEDLPAGEGALAGKSVLFTGALEAFSRKDAQEKVLAAGGKSASGVSSKLDILVVGAGKGPKSSKQKKAEKLVAEGASLEIIGEAEFLARVES